MNNSIFSTKKRGGVSLTRSLTIALLINLPVLILTAQFGVVSNKFLSTEYLVMVFLLSFSLSVLGIRAFDQKHFAKPPALVPLKMMISTVVALCLFSVVYVIYDTYFSLRHKSGLPFGHAGDFFQLLYLTHNNEYKIVTEIGYFPAIIVAAKLVLTLFEKAGSEIPLNFYNIGMYWLLSLCAFLYAGWHVAKMGRLYFAYVFLITAMSYPFILQLERGNWVLLSMVFMSLAFQTFDNRKFFGPAIGAFITLKVLNIFIIPLALMSKAFSVSRFSVSVGAIAIMSFVYLFYLFPGDASYSGVLGYVFSMSTFFPDAHIALAHSGVYALFRLLSIYFAVDGVVNPHSLARFLVALAAAILVFFFSILFFSIRRRRIEFDKKEFCIAYIFVLTSIKSLHPHMADMNLILYFPAFWCLISLNRSTIETAILSLVFVILLPFQYIQLFPITHDDQGRVFEYWFSMKHFVVPSTSLAIMLLIIFRNLRMIRSRSNLATLPA